MLADLGNTKTVFVTENGNTYSYGGSSWDIKQNSVLDRDALKAKIGTRVGEIVYQSDISLMYTWSEDSLTDNLGTIIADNGANGFWVASYSGAVDVKWFGIKSNASDETDLAQAAIDSLIDGQTLDLDDTNIRVTNLTITTPNITIKNGKIYDIESVQFMLLTITADNVTVKDVSFTVNAKVYSTTKRGCIGFQSVDGGLVTGCRLSGARRAGSDELGSNNVNVYNSRNVNISDNVMLDGWYCEMLVFGSSHYCTASNNIISGLNTADVRTAYSTIDTTNKNDMGRCSNITITGNVCSDTVTSNMTLNSTDYISVVGNTVNGSAQEQGINFGHTTTGCTNVTVSGNVINDCAGAGIYLADTSIVTATGNTITNCVETGITASGDTDAVNISGNVISDIGDSSVGDGVSFLSGTGGRCIVSNNSFNNIQGHGVRIGNTDVASIIVDGNTFHNINNGAFGGGRFPLGGTLSATTEIVEFTNNTVTGTAVVRCVSLSSSVATFILRLMYNTLPAITTTAELWKAESGTNPTCKNIEGNTISTDPMYGICKIDGGTSTITVLNDNQTPFSPPLLVARDTNAAQFPVYVSAFGAGTFTIVIRGTAATDSRWHYKIW